MSNFYITTSIPYVNGEPHIGHAYEFLAADVIARYMRQYKTPVIFCTGADEHGGKIAEKANEQHLTPKQLVDKNTATFVELLKELNISNDRFIRTTDEGHVKRAQRIWKDLSKFIYKGTYEGWYCTGCETFYPETTVKVDKGVCPLHDRPYEKLQEENYFFKLSAFTQRVKEAIETDALRIVPVSRKHEILNVIKDGLDDISISRPKDKISWGISVPEDSNQVMYVWFEALMNYITVLGYPEHKDFKDYWPANIQIIGKDILRFHAAIWPAMLLGLELPLPKVLYVHGFITVGDTKMSKSLGNVIAPKQIIDRYGIEAFRYFFMRHIPSYDDGDFTWERLDAAYNSELADQLGNAVSRTAAMIKNYQKGLIGDIPDPEHDIGPYKDAIENCRFDKALEEVWEQVRGVNQYLEETKPWEIAKGGDADHLREVLSVAVSSLLEIGVLITPFMPDTAAKIHDIFGSGTLKPLSGPMFPKTETKQA
jgi:methionyl-tRNA synthetase